MVIKAVYKNIKNPNQEYYVNVGNFVNTKLVKQRLKKYQFIYTNSDFPNSRLLSNSYIDNNCKNTYKLNRIIAYPAGILKSLVTLNVNNFLATKHLTIAEYIAKNFDKEKLILLYGDILYDVIFSKYDKDKINYDELDIDEQEELTINQ